MLGATYPSWGVVYIMNKLLFVLALGALTVVPQGNATPIDNLLGTSAAADHLLAVQFEDGAFPWIEGAPGKYQNVQGITAVGLLRAYELTGNEAYMGNESSGATANRDWLVNYMDANPGVFMSSSNAFFLGNYARITANPADYDEAQRAMNSAIARWGSAQELTDFILNARAPTYGNMGIWDVALFIRAAQEVGYFTYADEIAEALVNTEIVDAFDNTSNYYELGLAGLLFGLAESDFIGHLELELAARDALLATQCADGSFPTTWRGTVYCSEVQTTAYAVLGLTSIVDVVTAQSACDFLTSTQGEDGGWDVGGYQIAEINAEALMALAACVLPANNGVVNHVDVLVSNL